MKLKISGITLFWRRKMFNKSFVPSGITSLRLIAAPIFFYTILSELYLFSLMVFVFACVTDLLDGYIARRTDSTSNIGAYLDVTADFILIVTCFLAYIIIGWYDPLILVLITMMFALFVVTSGLKTPVYDPVGKYLGAFLMLTILLSLLFPEQVLRQVLIILLALFSLASIISRLFIFLRRYNASS